jgi:RNA polymerase sigma-70 factor (ECF subfamily)
LSGRVGVSQVLPAASSSVSDPSVSDAEVVGRARAGDAAAFGELYERYRDAIYRYCLARSGSPSDAEDLTSDVFLKAMRALGRYRQGSSPFLAFLYRIARNASIDRSRRRTEGSLFTLVVEPRANVDLEAHAERVSDMDLVMGALRKLKPDYREVILLRFVEGYEPSEVAALLGRDQRSVHNLQHRAMERLRRELDVKPGGDPK